MERNSLYREARRTAERYRDELVARLGPDVADGAICEWNQDEWWPWAADCVLQHLTGEAYWQELDPGTFACVSSETPQRQDLVAAVQHIRQTLDSGENIDYRQREKLFDRWGEILNKLLNEGGA